MGGIKMAKLDAYTMKPQFALFALMIIVTLVVFGFVSNSYAALGFTCAWLVLLVSTAVFQVQERDSLDRFYGTLSLSVTDIVIGRHLFVIGIFTSAILASIVVQGTLFIFSGQSAEGIDILFGIAFAFFAFSVIAAIQIPLYFRMGYLKARYLALIPYLIMMSLVFLPTFLSTFSEIATAVFDNQAVFISLFFLIGVLVLLGSCRVSIAAYKRHR